MEGVPGNTAGGTESGSQVGQAAEQAKQQTQQLAQRARQQAGELTNRGTEQVKSQLANQKHDASQRMVPVQTALRETAQQLRKQGQGSVGQYADQAADQVERFAGYLRETDVDEILNEVRGFAWQRPALFLGSSVALGFLATRFLKSSSQGGDGSGVTPTATSGATVTYGTEEPTTALPPRDVVVEPPTAGPSLSDRERREPPRDLRGQ
jgi:hypothetical protein